MKTLAEFLAEYLLDRKNFDKEEWPSVAEEYTILINAGINCYKIHLQEDSPKSVHWAMIEKDLIVALERMQSQDQLEGMENKINRGEMGCEEKPIEDMTTKELIESKAYFRQIKHPICPLALYWEGDEDKIDLSKCDFEKS